MRVASLVRLCLSGIGGFLTVTVAFIFALTVAITGPPSWAELSGLRDSFASGVGQAGVLLERVADAVSAEINRQVEVRTAEDRATLAQNDPAPESERADLVEAAPQPQLVVAPTPTPAPTRDDLAGGLNGEETPGPAPRPASSRTTPSDTHPRQAAETRAPAPRVAQANPSSSRTASSRVSQSRTPAPPRREQVRLARAEDMAPMDAPTLARRLADTIESALPAMKFGERTSAAEPTVGVSPLPHDDYAPSDPYADQETIEDEDDVRVRDPARHPRSVDRFPPDERDAQFWGTR